jgi:hypothetical protein
MTEWSPKLEPLRSMNSVMEKKGITRAKLSVGSQVYLGLTEWRKLINDVKVTTKHVCQDWDSVTWSTTITDASVSALGGIIIEGRGEEAIKNWRANRYSWFRIDLKTKSGATRWLRQLRGLEEEREFKHTDMCFLELAAVVVAVTHVKASPSQAVAAITDILGAAGVIRNMKSDSPSIHNLVTAMRPHSGAGIHPTHIPGNMNLVADAISRTDCRDFPSDKRISEGPLIQRLIEMNL